MTDNASTDKPFEVARIGVLLHFECGCYAEVAAGEETVDGSPRLRQLHACRDHVRDDLAKVVLEKVERRAEGQS